MRFGRSLVFGLHDTLITVVQILDSQRSQNLAVHISTDDGGTEGSVLFIFK